MLSMRPSVAVRTLLIGLLAGACIPATSLRTTPTPTPSPSAGDVDLPTATAPPTGPSAPPSFVRPTPTPQPTFLAYVVKPGDTLTSIARAHGTTARSIAFWNRSRHPSLDPDSPSYRPDRIEVGWVLLLVPDLELDPEDLPPETPPAPPATSPSPTVSAARGPAGTG
jgi:hypothetical protein